MNICTLKPNRQHVADAPGAIKGLQVLAGAEDPETRRYAILAAGNLAYTFDFHDQMLEADILTPLVLGLTAQWYQEVMEDDWARGGAGLEDTKTVDEQIEIENQKRYVCTGWCRFVIAVLTSSQIHSPTAVTTTHTYTHMHTYTYAYNSLHACILLQGGGGRQATAATRRRALKRG